jgi:hypothetical protein
MFFLFSLINVQNSKSLKWTWKFFMNRIYIDKFSVYGETILYAYDHFSSPVRIPSGYDDLNSRLQPLQCK